MHKRGIFITVEGGEGVGKSTNLGFLEDFLNDRGIETVLTREPGGTALGEEIRNLLLHNRSEQVSPMTELLLIFAARAQHIEECIEPARGRGELDRIERETLSFFERVRANYLERAASDPGRYRLVDAGVELEQVQQQIARIAEEIVDNSCVDRLEE